MNFEDLGADEDIQWELYYAITGKDDPIAQRHRLMELYADMDRCEFGQHDSRVEACDGIAVPGSVFCATHNELVY